MSGIDPAKLAAWFDALAAPLVLYARQWLGPDGGDRASSAGSAAEDVVQEAFVGLMGQPREPDNVRAWLYRAVRNAAVSAARSGGRRRRREREVAGVRSGWFEPRPGDPIDAAAAQAALNDLPPAQREVIVLRIWSGLTLAEVSQVTGLAVSSVFDLYRKGLGALRRAMESEVGLETGAKTESVCDSRTTGATKNH